MCSRGDIKLSPSSVELAVLVHNPFYCFFEFNLLLSYLIQSIDTFGISLYPHVELLFLVHLSGVLERPQIYSLVLNNSSSVSSSWSCISSSKLISDCGSSSPIAESYLYIYTA